MASNARQLQRQRQWPIAKISELDRNRQWGKPGGATLIDIDNLGVVTDPRLPATWETTSDALATWLALRWRAPTLIFAKQVNPLEPVMQIGKMRNLGWLDPVAAQLWEDRERRGQNRHLRDLNAASRPIGESAEPDSNGLRSGAWIRHFPAPVSPQLWEIQNRLWTQIVD